MRTAVLFGTGLPVISARVLRPPRRYRHHEKTAKTDDVGLVGSAQLGQSRVSLRRTVRTKTRAFQLAAQLLQIFRRQTIGRGVRPDTENLREIDDGVSRDRERDVRLPCWQP